MFASLGSLITVAHTDSDVRRRGRNVILIALSEIVICTLLVLVWITQRNYIAAVAATGVVLSGLAALALVRRGHVTSAALSLISLLIVILSAQMIFSQAIANGAFYMIAPLAVAAATLTRRLYAAIWAVALSCNALIEATLPAGHFLRDVELNALQDSSALLVFVGLVGMVSVFSLQHAAREAAAARAASEAAAGELARANAALEQRVAERTKAMSDLIDRERAQTAALQASVEQQRRLNDVINALALPVLPVRPDVIVAPLVGNIDGERAEQLLSELLPQIERRQARAIILDVTGVAVIDTRLASSLLQIATAARLLGTRTMLVGIRPEVAQALVGLGANLDELRTAATLYDGLRALEAEAQPPVGANATPTAAF